MARLWAGIRRPFAAETRPEYDPRLAVLLFGVFAIQIMLARWMMWDSVGLPAGLASDLAFAGVFALVISVVPGRWGSAVAVALTTAVSFILLSSVIYAGYYDALPTADMFAFMGQADDVKENIADLWSVLDIVFVGSPLVVAAAAFVMKPRGRKTGIGFVLVLLGVVGVFSWATVDLVRVEVALDSLLASQARGMASYQLASQVQEPVIEQEARAQEPTSLPEEIDAMLERDTATRIADFDPGIARGKNLIVIQFEALQTHAIDYRVGGREVTPNLNRLASKSWYFPNGVSQIAKGNTSDAEWASQTSLYPSMEKASTLQWGDREVPALPRLLGEEGYQTFTMHTNDAGFWNRRQLYAALGFGRYYDKTYFGGGNLIGGSAGDDVLYTKGIKVIKKADKRKRPFYAQIITISSHSPFKVSPKWQAAFPMSVEYQKAGLAGYLQSLHEADRAFGQFMAELERAGIMDDTVIVLFGDHYGPKLTKEAKETRAAKEFFGRRYSAMDRLTIPVMIKLPGQTDQVVDVEPVAEMDIMPTIADLVGLDISGVPHFGRSAFMHGRTLIGQRRYVPNGSYVRTDGLVHLSGLGFDGAIGAPLRGRVAAVPVLLTDYQDAARLMQMSDQYANSLPRRRDAYADPTAKIPTKAGLGQE